MKKVHYLSLIVFGIIFSGCGMKYMSHTDMIQKHRGQNIESLIAQWGAPLSTTPLPSGNSVYLFETESVEREKTSEIRKESYGRSDEDETIAVYSNVVKKCKTTVTADKKGEVLSLNSTGTGCQGSWIKSAE